MRCFNIAIYRGYMTGWGLVEGTEGEGFDVFAGRIVGSKCWIPERVIKVSYKRGQRVVFGHCTHFNASNRSVVTVTVTNAYRHIQRRVPSNLDDVARELQPR